MQRIAARTRRDSLQAGLDRVACATLFLFLDESTPQLSCLIWMWKGIGAPALPAKWATISSHPYFVENFEYYQGAALGVDLDFAINRQSEHYEELHNLTEAAVQR